MDSLQRLLEKMGLGEYTETFAANRIDVDVLLDLAEEDLEKLSIPLGDRKRFLKAVASLRASADTGGSSTTSSGGNPVAWERAEDSEPESAKRLERRQLTLMFIDLVGSTALSAHLDLEEYRDLILKFHETSAATISDHDGFIAQLLGDGVLAYFGYPRAGEDDAERAVSAGLAITRAVGAMESEPGVSLQARVGIATGLVAVGDLTGEGLAEKSAATGETPNLAARLQALAMPGTVVVSDVTQNLLGKQFVCRDLGVRSLKGFSEPVPVWEVTKERFSNSRFESHHHGSLTPFVGREEEIELLHRRWRNTKSGSGQTVLISGEPGIGKSRLTQEFYEQLLSEPHSLLRFQCLPNRKDSPLHPVIARLERTVGFTTTDSPSEKLDRLVRWLQRDSRDTRQAAAVFARLLSLTTTGTPYETLDLEPKELKKATFKLLLDQFGAQLKKSPLIMIFEDLHWIDPTSQDLLDALIQWIGSQQVLLVCTCRPEYEAQWIGDAGVMYLHLRRLDGRQSAEFFEKVSGGLVIPPEVEATILTKTDGVPLFLEELTKTVLESGSLRREGRTYTYEPSSDVLGTLPTTLRSSLLARLDRIAGAQYVAPLGAAIGRTFSYDLLHAIVDLDEEKLLSILSLLLDAQLLTQRQAFPDARYRFKHALVQDAAYETLPKGRRREVHGRIATVLGEKFPEISESNPEVLADHYARSNEPAKAYKYWRRAALIARQHSANVEAIAHIKNALIANQHTLDNGTRISNEIQLREMLYVPLEVTHWGSKEIAENLDQLRKLREARGDTEELLSILNGIAGDHVMGGRVSETRKIAHKMLQMAHHDVTPVAGVVGYRFLGICDFLSGRFSDAVSHLEKTIALCATVGREDVRKYYYADTVLMSRCYIAWSLILDGKKVEGDKATTLAIQLAEKETDIHSKMYALCILASIYQSAGYAGECFKVASRALDLSQEYGSRYWEAWAQVMKGWALAAEGGYNQGIEELQGGIAKYAETGSRQMLPYARTLLADAYCRAGHAAEGLDLIQDIENDPEFTEIRSVDVLRRHIRSRLSASPNAW